MRDVAAELKALRLYGMASAWCYAPLKLSLSDPSYSGATNGACPSVMWAGHAPGKERDRNAIYLTAAKSRGGRGRR